MKTFGQFLFMFFVFAILSCTNPSSSSDGSSGSGNSANTLKTLVAGLPDIEYQIPESLENASRSIPTRAASYDSTGEEAVMGMTMWDLMYNHLADLAEGQGTWGSVFLRIVKEIGADSSYTIESGTTFDLGVRDFPTGTTGPNGEASMDFGKMRITEDSSDPDLTHIHWLVPFASIPGASDGGIYYINMEITKLDASGNIKLEVRMAFRPNDNTGTPLDVLMNESYELVNTSRDECLSYSASSSERNIFQQYTDSTGMIRTFFNASCREDEAVANQYQLLFFMAGNANQAGLLNYNRQADGAINSPKREAYNSQGQLMCESENGNYAYPLLTLKKTGYAIATDEAGGYWMENDGDLTYDAGTDIDLSAAGAGTVTEDYSNSFVVDNVNNFCPGQYTKWNGGTDFVNQPTDLYQTTTELTGLDSSDEIAVIDAYLDAWEDELESDGLINIAGDDMISLPDLATMQSNMGFPLVIGDFPDP